jgi:hypothetical protein
MPRPRRPKRPGRPKLPRADKRSRVVTLWLTPAEYTAVIARVVTDETTISAWFREHGLAPLGLGTDVISPGSES